VKKALLLLLILALSCLGFSATQKKVVRPNDQVTLSCDEEASLNRQYTIDKDGFIVMQYVGAVDIGGLSENAAGLKIGATLVNARIVPKATVHLQIVSSRPGVISYSGAIKSGGEMQPKDGLRLSDVVAAAQPTNNANLQRVRVVTAAGNEFLVNYAAYDGQNNVNNPALRAGDHIFFDYTTAPPAPQPSQGGAPTISQPDRPSGKPTPSPAPSSPPTYTSPQGLPSHREGSITVLGAVANPRTVAYSDGMSVADAIAAAGGITKDAQTDKVKVERKIDGNLRTYTENYGDVKAGMAGDMALRPKDVVEVPYKGHGNRFGRNLKIGAAILLGLVLLHP
jgi:protein involved in polysaccharide export with SLBB domain